MSKDEWLDKIGEWAKSDKSLERLPYMFYVPLAEKLAQYDAQKSAQSDGNEYCQCELPRRNWDFCVLCGLPIRSKTTE